MSDRTERTKLLFGEEGIRAVKNGAVLLFGVGGVGSYALEALARVGIPRIGIVDGDIVSPTDLNRQLIATESTLGMPKTEAGKKRVKDIDKEIVLDCYPFFYSPETKDKIDFSSYNYIVDAIDDVWAKVDIIERAKSLSIPVISVMGMGNKWNGSMVTVADISKTEVCPLARAVRVQLRKKGINNGVKTVFSKEIPQKNGDKIGSLPFVPSVAGLVAVGEVIKDLIKNE